MGSVALQRIKQGEIEAIKHPRKLCQILASRCTNFAPNWHETRIVYCLDHTAEIECAPVSLHNCRSWHRKYPRHRSDHRRPQLRLDRLIAAAQPTAFLTAPLEQGEDAVASKLADELIKSFVYRDQAEAYAVMLRKNAAAGRYNSGIRRDMAKQMTDDLLAVHRDGHLRVMVTDPSERQGSNGGSDAVPKGFPPLIQSARDHCAGHRLHSFQRLFRNTRGNDWAAQVARRKS